MTTMEEGGDSSPRPYKKKKSKKSYLQKARKYGKKGQFGRGREIDRDTYDYFVRVLENLSKDEFEDDEAKENFVHNVFQQTEGEEITLCGNQLVSRVIERLLPKSHASVRRRFMEKLGDDLRVASTDPFASHILQKLMVLGSFSPSEGDEEEEVTFAKNWAVKVSKFAIANFDTFVYDPYASHIMRTGFQCLSGSRLSEVILRSKRSRGQMTSGEKEELSDLKDFEPEEEHLTSLLQAVEKVKGHENLSELVRSDTSSGVLMALILVLKTASPKEQKSLIKELVEKALPIEVSEETGIAFIFDEEPCCRLLEVIITEMKEGKAKDKIFAKFLDGKLAKLSQHGIANFAVQKLLDSCEDKEKFEEWYENEFDKNLEEILAAGNTGVVLSIAKACRRLGAKQGHFLVSLMQALHCYEPASLQAKFVPLLARMATKEALDSAETPFPIHINGSLLVQELLSFNKPIKIIASLLGMNASELKSLLCDPKGSHITDAFMNSKTVGEKSRDGLVKSLNGELVAMACNKHGSRSLDAIWKAGSLKAKESLCHELSAQETLLNSNPFGKFISQNFALSLFKRARDDWKQNLNRAAKKRDIFSDIIGGTKNGNSAKVKSEEAPPAKKVKVEEKVEVEVKEEVKEEPQITTPEKKVKKKKKKTKSYLDDL